MTKESEVDLDLLSFVGGLEDENSAEDDDHSMTRNYKKSNKVNLAELTAVLGDETGYQNLKDRLEEVANLDGEKKGERKRKNKKVKAPEVIAAPLAPHEQTRLERQAAYSLAATEVNKWVPIVRENRKAKSLQFPAPHQLEFPTSLSQITKSTLGDFDKMYDDALKEAGIDTEDSIMKGEELEMAKLTAEEVEARYAELAKKRALLFYSERKNKRQAKIKSKEFRKHVRKEKEKKLIKSIEASGDRLTEEEIREERLRADLERIKERMTLKTRKASKWAHDLVQKRKLETGSREEIMQQVRDKDRLRQEIMGKAAQFNNEFGSGSELDEENAEAEYFEDAESDEEEDEDSKKSAIPKRLLKRRNSESSSSENEDYFDEEDGEPLGNEVDEIFAEQKTALQGDTFGRMKFNPEKPISLPEAEVTTSTETSKKRVKLDLVEGGKGSFSKEKKKDLAVGFNDLFNAEDFMKNERDEKTIEQLQIIKEAFAEDEVFADFEAMKRAEIDAEKPQEIDLSLPGWGSWGGEGIAAPKNKVILKKKDGVEPAKRQDIHLQHVIIHEKMNRKVAKLMVSRPPFPYRSKEEYERKLQTPLGSQFSSTLKHLSQVTPRVRVKAGHVIEPIKYEKAKDNESGSDQE